ncbi:ADP-ribosylglycohydrolase family protein [Streptomyces sp. NBC_01205]|uniref:ADP-ribosylglycohydrolase family protein n=1 Tax=Streptomyces sp. NBC_01205 TaxID=2903771 RepID=UPI002E0FAA91|nr:ADP-ribosylglycohydrolase family protein [Streptomyces sp. NBC_01205]
MSTPNPSPPNPDLPGPAASPTPVAAPHPDPTRAPGPAPTPGSDPDPATTPAPGSGSDSATATALTLAATTTPGREAATGTAPAAANPIPVPAAAPDPVTAASTARAKATAPAPARRRDPVQGSGPAPARAEGPGTAEVAAQARGPEASRPPAGVRRIEGVLLGLAAGDAAGWPAARHRASRMPEWTRRLTRELDTFAEQNQTTTLPVPIALNQPPEPLRLGPSDDAEWAAFAAESVLTAAGVLLSDLSRSRRMRAAIDLAWNALASEIAAAAERAPEVESAVLPLRARISVRAGLGNLAAGLRPPATGHDNPHYFDDAACVRACVLAVVHPGDPAAAADLAEFDARYTQDGDGVHGARAMAAAIAVALAGADPDTAVDAALGQLPEATEIGRNARHAVKLARTRADGPGSAFAIVPTLEHEIVDHVYSYGIAAAETVPVALALTTAARGRASEAVPAAACLSRVADSAPALAGALTGALGGGDSIPTAWREACRTLSGCALPRLAGTDLVELAALLARTELTSPKG